jgi:hypothetical protein
LAISSSISQRASVKKVVSGMEKAATKMRVEEYRRKKKKEERKKTFSTREHFIQSVQALLFEIKLRKESF